MNNSREQAKTLLEHINNTEEIDLRGMHGIARRMLIEVLAKDYANRLRDDHMQRLGVSTTGFSGFEKMPDTELLQAVADAGIGSQYLASDDFPEILSAIQLLKVVWGG